MNKPLNIVLYILFFIFLIGIGSIVINDGSVILANVCKYIITQFECANLDFSSPGGGCTIRLLLLATFVGWAIYRFKNMKK